MPYIDNLTHVAMYSNAIKAYMGVLNKCLTRVKGDIHDTLLTTDIAQMMNVRCSV